MKATRQQVDDLAKQLGVTVEYAHDSEGIEHELTVEAPAGKVWVAADVHELVCAGSDREPWSSIYADAITRMKHGLADCTTPDCEWCER